MTNDEALMLAFQRGSREAFDELFARYRGPLYGFFPQRYASSYERLLDDFVSKARSDEPFSVTIHDGLRSLALAEAARRSADNRLPISMSAIS